MMLDPDTYAIETVASGDHFGAPASSSRGKPHDVLDHRPPRRGDARSGMAGNGRAFPLRLFHDIDVNTHKNWLIDDMLGAGELSVWYGPPGCGKSVLVSDAACHVAAGQPWQGRPVEAGGVLYVAAERATLVERRLSAWGKHHGLRDIPLAVIRGGFDLCTNVSDADRIVATAADLEVATGVHCRWIIIDTKAQVMGGGDENSAVDVSRLVDNLAHIQRATGAHVTIIDHTPHDAPHRMRGHGALLGAADATFRVAKGERVRTMMVEKANDSPDDVTVSFTLEGVALGTDPRTGKVTEAPVVIPADPPDKAGHVRVVRLTNPEELALRMLGEAICDHGQAAPDDPLNTRGAKAVSETLWRDLCYRRQITASGRQDARQKAFKRAADGLQRKGRIGVSGGWVWLA